MSRRSTDPWLWLKAEGLEGWGQATMVVPVDQALDLFTEAIRAKPNDAFSCTMRGLPSSPTSAARWRHR